MKKYQTPDFELLELSLSDVITTSPGTETDPMPDNGGIWDLELG